MALDYSHRMHCDYPRGGKGYIVTAVMVSGVRLFTSCRSGDRGKSEYVEVRRIDMAGIVKQLW